MWRTNKFTGNQNQDSDQSLSEDEEFNEDFAENYIPLGGSPEKKGGVQVLSQLEVLRDAHELDHATKPAISSPKRQAGTYIQDEVDISVFHHEGDFTRFPRRESICKSDDEINSDEEGHRLRSLGSTRKNGSCTWFLAAREADALVHLNENAGCSSSHTVLSKTNKSFKGGRGKPKTKFAFHFQPQKDPFEFIISKDEAQMLPKVISLHDEPESDVHRTMGHSMSELLDLYQGEKIEQLEHSVPAEVEGGLDPAEHSMSDIFDCLQENNALHGGNSITYSRTEGERAQAVVRSMSTLGDSNIYDDDSPEAFDSGSSSGDEGNHQNLKLIVPESKGKTMADQFQEALGAASVHDDATHFAVPRQLGIGLFGKLQRVMQSEKERDTEFLERLHAEASLTDEGYRLDVRILSRCLEAKLTVCCCSFVRDEESGQCVDDPKGNGARSMTIIFSSRTCSDVELEVGKLIRIHPPWKEIHVKGKNETVMLATYFSQISR